MVGSVGKHTVMMNLPFTGPHICGCFINALYHEDISPFVNRHVS